MPTPRTPSKKLPRSTLRGQLVGKVLTSIFSGEVHGGDRLIEEELAARLGVSRTPIREALGELAAIGVIRLAPNRGAVVQPFGPQQLIEIYHVRRILEVEATRMAGKNIDPAALREVRQETLALAEKKDHDVEWSEQALTLDVRFHNLISRSSGSERLAQEIERYRELVFAVGDAVGNKLHAHDHNQQEHLAVIDHLLAYRPEEAAAAMGNHISRAAETAAEALGMVYTNGAKSAGGN
jgi:DNA-binding GntR family transcriptional regulator